jgi:hypothetical protein
MIYFGFSKKNKLVRQARDDMVSSWFWRLVTALLGYTLYVGKIISTKYNK